MEDKDIPPQGGPGIEKSITEVVPPQLLKVKLKDFEKLQLRFLLSSLIHFNENLTLKDLKEMLE